MAKDPICRMEVAEATALHAEGAGKTAYFCREKLLSGPAGVKSEENMERTQ